MHFYSRDGKPAYEVPNKSAGGMRPTNIADAKKHGYVPSVTTVMALLDKPAIKQWEKQQLLEAVKSLDWTAYFSIDNLFKDVYKYIEEKKGNKRGSELHSQLETYYSIGSLPKDNDKDFILPVVTLIKERLIDTHAQSELSFCHEDGFGGQVDLCNREEDWILDFKTKSKEKLIAKECVYDDHLMQLAAYRKGLDMPTAKCYNLFISTATPGEVLLIEHKEKDLQRGWQMFSTLLKFWRLKHHV